VCKYPVDPDGTRNAPAGGPDSLAAWSRLGHDYWSSLAPAAKVSSCELRGPCYPVLWATSASWATCQPATLSGLPLAPGRVAAFRTCVACCGALPPRAATCVPPVFTHAARNATRSTYNPSDDGQYLSCLASCENTHDSIDELIAAQTSTIDTTAAGLFASACAAAGAPSTPVPLPSGNGTSASAVSSALTALLTAQTAQIARYVADVANSWRTLVVCGLALPAALALSWLFLLRSAAAALVWSTVFAANGAALAGTLYCFAKAGRLGDAGALQGVSDALLSRAGNGTISALAAPDTSSHERHAMYALGVAAAVATSLLWALTAAAVPRLRLATATLRVAVGTLGAAPALALAPLFTFFAGVAFLVWWVAAGVYMYASGDVVRRDCCAEVQAAWADALAGVPPALVPLSLAAPTCADIHCGYVVAPDWRLRATLLYHAFELFWAFHFLHAFTLLVVADVTFEAYMARGTGSAMPAAPVWHAARTAAAFYLGSLALGSLLAAAAQLWALPLAIAIYHLSRAHKLRGGDGIAAGATLCGPPSTSTGALAWSLGVMRALRSRVGPNAWALLTVEGRPYCASAKAVNALLAANEETVAPVHAVGDTLCVLGKLGISAGCAFWAFVYLDVSPPSMGISSPLLPVIVVALTAFIVATQFIGVVQQCIETTLVAFCDDTAAHGGVAACSPPELREALEGLKEARARGAGMRMRMRSGVLACVRTLRWLTRACVCVFAGALLGVAAAPAALLRRARRGRRGRRRREGRQRWRRAANTRDDGAVTMSLLLRHAPRPQPAARSPAAAQRACTWRLKLFIMCITTVAESEVLSITPPAEFPRARLPRRAARATACAATPAAPAAAQPASAPAPRLEWAVRRATRLAAAPEAPPARRGAASRARAQAAAQAARVARRRRCCAAARTAAPPLPAPAA
jgi:hypothetical protein